jgi:acetyl/propionyl-CoA carboxylase alpha subunit/acetyl-CoA carboxylase carboxyltransferase component
VDPKDGERKVRYLDYAVLEKALIETQAEAAWVGWGFVAEHAEFAELCKKLGVTFIGPSGDVMRRVGDKIASKLLAESVGVPVAPWSQGAVETVEAARTHAHQLSYPIMIKATAGGGGRGVRRVKNDEELVAAFDSARIEALKFFGSSTVFIERAIVGARHIEVQVLADHFGTCWAVGVRDCTIQRRNQKVVEEAPSPALDEVLENEVRAAAVRMATAAMYTNAGTVEFLFDPLTRAFYFMEINTRLQVEHPVTELTTGIDLVKHQLLVENGGRLTGEPPKTVGHAVEVRLNAEDADRNFAPAPGRVELFQLPTGPGLRVDTGVAQGDEIASEFDSMIAKVIAFGKDRNEALARLRRGLQNSRIVIRGGTSNKAFLLDLLSMPELLENRNDIGWLDRTWMQREKTRPDAGVALIHAAIDHYERERAIERKTFFVAASRGRASISGSIGRVDELSYGGEKYTMSVRSVGANRYRILVDNRRLQVSVERQSDHERQLRICGKRYRVVSSFSGTSYLVEVNGITYRVSRDDGGSITAPSPAVVLAVHVKPGDEVQAGATLVVLEAMKMEMAIVAPCACRIRAVSVQPKIQVAAGAQLLSLESDAKSETPSGGVRIQFPELDSSSKKLQDEYLELLHELKLLILGFDIDARDAKDLLARLVQVRQALDVDDQQIYRSENDVLEVFADLVSVNEMAATTEDGRGLSAEESLLTYLRSVHLLGKGVPVDFVARLKTALAHYGIESLDPTVELDDALVLLYRSTRRAQEYAQHVLNILDFRLRYWVNFLPFGDKSFRLLLDRIIASSQGRLLLVNDVAREARFRFFDRPLFEDAQSLLLRRVGAMLTRTANTETGPKRQRRIAALVNSRTPMLGLLASRLLSKDDSERLGSLEVFIRRCYYPKALQLSKAEIVEGFPFAIADVETREGTKRLIALHTAVSQIENALSVAQRTAAEDPSSAPTVVDIVSVYEDDSSVIAKVRSRLGERMRERAIAPNVETVCFTFVGVGLGQKTQYVTFVLSANGGYREHPIHPVTHPTVAERMELWRLHHFKTEQLPSPEHIYLFHAIAHDNPRDERLFSFVDVPDVTARRKSDGKLSELPHLEYLFLEAAAGIREFQARRPARDRLLWNRILLFVRPTADLTPMDMSQVAHRLAPAARNLGLEKTVVYLESKDQTTGSLRPRVVDISNRTGTGMHLEIKEPSSGPLLPLSEYARRVVLMRRLGLIYAYEIVKMLTPSVDAAHAEFPEGTFVEYELDTRGALSPVARELGNNPTNVVVGVITNRTQKHPEGMRRVILLSDASQGMGALAEPECRRIIAALNLAEQLSIPLEWFPVSSGAKIAMDVGTEALDWVAHVLKRIVEYTQSGGEINVVIGGVNVGGQSYFNAESTMLMHTKGVLIMTPEASMVLTGKRALDYSGAVSAETNEGIGGVERIMGPNGQAQYVATDLVHACKILFAHYEHHYVAPQERAPRRAATVDPFDRDVCVMPLRGGDESGLKLVGDIFSDATNPGRKKPFDIRSVMRAVSDQDFEPLERWEAMRNAETAVVWDAHVGGIPVCLLGIESKSRQRLGIVPGDGPTIWSGGTLYPQSSKKIARALNAASGRCPIVVLANLSGFDGSPESMRELQLEYGAEIGRAVVNFRGPLVFCVISRYHGGAYVVFSGALNEQLRVIAVEGAHASVIGGAPAAAVVFPKEVKALTLKDSRVRAKKESLGNLSNIDRSIETKSYEALYQEVYAEKQSEVAEQFDRIHSVERAKTVGSVDEIIKPKELRPFIIRSLEEGIERWLQGQLVAAE